jgi:hypothetical protein
VGTQVLPRVGDDADAVGGRIEIEAEALTIERRGRL